MNGTVIPILILGKSPTNAHIPTETMSNTIDATGYNCPIPVLKARKAIKSLNAGDEIVVLASDPASAIDIPHFCNTTGNELLEQSEDDGVFRYLIRKAD